MVSNMNLPGAGNDLSDDSEWYQLPIRHNQFFPKHNGDISNLKGQLLLNDIKNTAEH